CHLSTKVVSVCLVLSIHVHTTISAWSIAPNGQSSNRLQQPINTLSSIIQQQQQQHMSVPMTTQSSLVTQAAQLNNNNEPTIASMASINQFAAQNNNLSSISMSLVNQQQSNTGTNDNEPTPSTATINNHSHRLSQSSIYGGNVHYSHNNNDIDNQLSSSSSKPAQYVDSTALRDRNSSMSLSPKSRSGLPECATQQVCNAIFVNMSYTQRLCECSSNYNWKCSFNTDAQDGHTIELTRKYDKRIYTQIKTCEPLKEVRACKSPTDWTLLALQSERTGKAHYVVVCKCPTYAQLEGPYTHNHPPYANIPGIRVYGMLCAHQTARSSQSYAELNPKLTMYPEFPWSELHKVMNSSSVMSTIEGF
ncbi:hypothetical protein GZH46_01840, partial [Fragariocoptes setiger]